MRWLSARLPLAVLSAALLSPGVPEVLANPFTNCRCVPGDDCWPAKSSWDAFNATVGGTLVATVPIGSPCHDPTYDEAKCNALRFGWINPMTHVVTSSSVMQTYFTNHSCDPFSDRSTPCQLGNYVSYAVKARDASDVAKVVKFATRNNIRLVVRNTGHDFLGRSTAAGALAVWTQGFKDISFSTRSDRVYKGPVVTMGAGVLGYELLQATQAHNLAVLSGECPTVGVAGGYTQGGGHSLLSTSFGLAADQTLEFEVVTASGKIVTASPQKNPGLYWALSGGGAGNYGIVTSMTVRAYRAAQVGGGRFHLTLEETTPEKLTKAVALWHTHVPRMVDKGAMVVFVLAAGILNITTITTWDKPGDYTRDEILSPFFRDLKDQLDITVDNTEYTTLSLRDHYQHYLGPLPEGVVPVAAYQAGGRLIPRRILDGDSAAYSAAIWNIANSGLRVFVSAADYTRRPSTPANAVLPAWRTSIAQVSILDFYDPTGPFEGIIAAQNRVTDEFMPQLEAVTPNSGVYMNEADYLQDDWQQLFYGENYGRLSLMKKIWDPWGLFWVWKGVGSEAWTERGGRLCRTW